MKLLIIFLIHGFELGYGVQLECRDKDVVVCKQADCASPVGRLVCPKRCGLCISLCQDTGQHCDVADCSNPDAQGICRRTCNVCDNKFPDNSSTNVEICVDTSSFCSPTLCGEWSRAMEDCRKTCHPSCRYQIQDGFEQDSDFTTTLIETSTTVTTTTITETTTTNKAKNKSPKPTESTKCRCLDAESGRTFDELSILKVDTEPGCSIRFICGAGCSKIYRLPEHCVPVTESRRPASTRATTKSSTTTKTTTTATTTTPVYKLPTISYTTQASSSSIAPYVPKNECHFQDHTIKLHHYHFVNNCEYVQCVNDGSTKPFIYLRNGCFAPTKLTVLQCYYSGLRMTVGEVTALGCGAKCTYQVGDLKATLTVKNCQNQLSHNYLTTPRTTKQTKTRKTTQKTTTTKKPRTTRTTRPRTVKTRTTKPPKTKKPKRVPQKWKRLCKWRGRTLKVGHYRKDGHCRYVKCATHANYETAVIYLYENDCNMPSNPGKPTTTKRTTTSTTQNPWLNTYNQAKR